MRLSFSLALLLTLAACDTGPVDLGALRVDALSQDPDALIGTWDLVSLTTGDPVGTSAPRRTDTYTFRADGTATRVYDGGAPEETTWEVRYTGYLADAPPRLYIGDRSEYFGIDGDRLYFDDRPVDGPLSEYARR